MTVVLPQAETQNQDVVEDEYFDESCLVDGYPTDECEDCGVIFDPESRAFELQNTDDMSFFEDPASGDFLEAKTVTIQCVILSNYGQQAELYIQVTFHTQLDITDDATSIEEEFYAD